MEPGRPVRNKGPDYSTLTSQEDKADPAKETEKEQQTRLVEKYARLEFREPSEEIVPRRQECSTEVY